MTSTHRNKRGLWGTVVVTAVLTSVIGVSDPAGASMTAISSVSDKNDLVVAEGRTESESGPNAAVVRTMQTSTIGVKHNAGPENPRQADAQSAENQRIEAILERSKIVQSMRPHEVSSLQRLLNEFSNAGLVVDSDYGVATARAVFRFQEAHGLDRDFVSGPQVLGLPQV